MFVLPMKYIKVTSSVIKYIKVTSSVIKDIKVTSSVEMITIDIKR